MAVNRARPSPVGWFVGTPPGFLDVVRLSCEPISRLVPGRPRQSLRKGRSRGVSLPTGAPRTVPRPVGRPHCLIELGKDFSAVTVPFFPGGASGRLGSVGQPLHLRRHFVQIRPERKRDGALPLDEAVERGRGVRAGPMSAEPGGGAAGNGGLRGGGSQGRWAGRCPHRSVAGLGARRRAPAAGRWGGGVVAGRGGPGAERGGVAGPAFDERAEGWFRALLRFTRPDGSPVFAADPGGGRAGAPLRLWAAGRVDPGLEHGGRLVVPPAPRRPGRHVAAPAARRRPPRPPAGGAPRDWSRDGDLLAVDHREPGLTTRFDLSGTSCPLARPDLGVGAGARGRDRGPGTPVLWDTRSAGRRGRMVLPRAVRRGWSARPCSSGGGGSPDGRTVGRAGRPRRDAGRAGERR